MRSISHCMNVLTAEIHVQMTPTRDHVLALVQTPDVSDVSIASNLFQMTSVQMTSVRCSIIR